MSLATIEQLKPGDTFNYEGTNPPVRVTVLRPAVEARETVVPLAGRPVWHVWCRREDTGAEGFMSYGRPDLAVTLIESTS